MPSFIKRALTATVGQNGLQKWLASPELVNPLVDQSTSLQPCQELLPFQNSYRYIQQTIVLAGAQTIGIFTAEVPLDEAWEIDIIGVQHDSAGTISFSVDQSHRPLLAIPIILTRQDVLADRMQPLIGSPPFTVAASVGRYQKLEPIKALPGDTIVIGNITSMDVFSTIILVVRYKLIPIPLAIEVPEAGLFITSAA